jgi:hypothetical protein
MTAKLLTLGAGRPVGSLAASRSACFTHVERKAAASPFAGDARESRAVRTRSSSRRSLSAKRSCGFAVSGLGSFRARRWTRCFKRWLKDEAARRSSASRTSNAGLPRCPGRVRESNPPSSPRQHPSDFRSACRIRPLFRRPAIPDEIQRDQLVRALRRAGHADHGRRLGGVSHRQASGRPVLPDATCLASGCPL